MQAPYVVKKNFAIAVYYTIVDPLIAMFVKRRENPPTTLPKAYAEVISVNLQMKHLRNGSSVNGRNGLNNYPMPSINGFPFNHPMTPNVYPSVVHNGKFP